MVKRRALVTGATGQDGRLMTRLLQARGYAVVGTSRNAPPGAIGPEGCPLLACSLTDQAEAIDIVDQVRPHEIYNFAAFSTGSEMFDDPVSMGNVNGQGPVRLLEAIRQVDRSIRFFQASSSEMFGARSPAPQSAATRLDPRSPYGAAKQYAHTMIDIYRDRHAIFACSAILFNHESPLRPATFVTRKITQAAARIRAGLQSSVMVGSLDVRRDWGYAGDYVMAAWIMLQEAAPDDYAVATGVTHSVGDLARTAFEAVDLDYRDHVLLDTAFSRPSAEVALVGDASALRAIGWAPEVGFEDMIRQMVYADMRLLESER